MPSEAGANLLTTAEAADYLRIGERKLYELVAAQAIPCTKLTGKWLFPRAELDRWLLAGLHRPPGMVAAAPPPIVGGSHDPLLQWALAESGSGLAMLAEGSWAGFRRFLDGELVASAIHFHHLDDMEGDGNLAIMTATPGLHDAVLIAFARRQQGLLTAPGNPLALTTVEDAARRGARFAVRPAGAGAQQLLLALLKRAGFGPEALTDGVRAPTGLDVAQAIRAGHAACGIATLAVANAAGLDFIPLATERFDLVMRQRDSYRPPLQALVAFLRSAEFAARARELGGFDVAEAGRVRWAP